MGTEIEVAQVTNALAQFDKVGLGLAELEKSYKGVIYPVREKDGMKAALVARRAIREPRVAVEKLRKEAKAPILALGKKLDSEAQRITTALEALENPIDEQIKNEEDRLHNEAVARAIAERERVEMLEARLESIRLMPFESNGLSSKDVQAILEEAKALPIGDDWQEFKEKAATAKIATVAALEGVLAKALAGEAEAARIIKERAELAVLRAEQVKRETEARESQEAANARIAVAQKLESDRLAAETAKLAKERQAAEDQHQAEQAKLAAERKAFESEQKERVRLDNIGFRAHHEDMTDKQALQLRALSDQSPETDVYKLVLPEPEKPKKATKEIKLDEHTEKALDALDAAVFSGDGFHSNNGVIRFEFFLGRWSREVLAIKKMLLEEGND